MIGSDDFDGEIPRSRVYLTHERADPQVKGAPARARRRCRVLSCVRGVPLEDRSAGGCEDCTCSRREPRRTGETRVHRGGEPNAYDLANVWVDEKGFLHLQTVERGGRWTCAEVSLTRSLGYGTYDFVVQDIAHLPPSAVVGLLTYDDTGTETFGNEIDVELSRWGDPKRKNSQCVVQPYYVAENVFRFESRPGKVMHSFRWEPGRLTFQSGLGSEQGPIARPAIAHTFLSGVPVP